KSRTERSRTERSRTEKKRVGNGGKRPERSAPPFARRGYALFVKLWGLKADTQVGEAVARMDALDHALIQAGGQGNWFASPYGGAIFVERIEPAIEAARTLIAKMTRAGNEISIGVSWGRFERVYNVSQWNAAATPINLAARM